MHSEKALSDDDHFKGQEGVQKLTDRYIKEVDTILEEKSKSLEMK
jgi:ribosome recycling factor